MANEVVEKYRLEGDTSGASAAVKKFEAEHDRSLSAIERKAKVAAIEQQAAAEKAAAAQTAAAEKAQAAQDKAMQKALIKVELLKKAFNLATRAVSEWGRAAIEAEKGMEEQDQVVTKLAASWDKFNEAMGVSIAHSERGRAVIGAMTDALDYLSQAAQDYFGTYERIAARKGEWTGAEGAMGEGRVVGTYTTTEITDPAADKAKRAQEKARDRAEKIRDLNKEIFDRSLEDLALQEKRELDAWQFKEDAKTKIAEEAEKNRLDVVKRGEEWQEKQQAESLRKFEKAQAERQAVMEANAQEASQVSTTIASTFAEGVDSVIEGGTLGFGKFLAGLGRTIGTMLIGRGAADVSMGNATSANIYTPGMGIPQTTMGGVEIALGSAMLVGGLAAGAAMANGGGGGGAGGAGSAGSTAIPTQQTPETITVNLTTLGKWGQSEHAAFQRQLGGALGRRYR